MKIKYSEHVNANLIKELKRVLKAGQFPKLQFEEAMQFLLSDGLAPKTEASIETLMKFEEWFVRYVKADKTVVVTTSDLKNRTGEIVNYVLEGKTVLVSKHHKIIGQFTRV